MKKITAVLIAAFAFVSVSLAQTVPYPFNSSGSSVAADAGAFNIFSTDGGQVNWLTVGSLLTSSNQITANGANAMFIGTNQGKIWLDANANGSISEDGNSSSANIVLARPGSGGIKLGGTAYAAFTGMTSGPCTLSSGTCNAVVPGATGSSGCFVAINGTYARDAGTMTCYAQADAGSATAFCQTAALAPDPAPAPVTIFCVN